MAKTQFKNGNVTLSGTELLAEGPKLKELGYTMLPQKNNSVRFVCPEHLRPQTEDKGTPKTFEDSTAAKLGFTPEKCDQVYKFVVKARASGLTSEETVGKLIETNPTLTSEAIWAAFRVGKARNIATKVAETKPVVQVPREIVLPEVPDNDARAVAESKSEELVDKFAAMRQELAVASGFPSYLAVRKLARSGNKEARKVRDSIQAKVAAAGYVPPAVKAA